MDARPRNSSLLRKAGPAVLLCALPCWLGVACGPPEGVDRSAAVVAGDGPTAGASGGRGGSGAAIDAGGDRGGTGGAGGSAGDGDAPPGGTGGQPVPDGGGTGGSGATGGSGVTGGIDGGVLVGDAPVELDLPPDLPPDLPLPPDVPPGPPELARGRVGHWKLDEGRGNVCSDSSGIGNHGGTVNILGPDWQAGRLGTGLTFSPVRRTFVIVHSHPTLGPTEAISLSVWVNAASWDGAPRILQKADDDGQYSLRAENGKLRFVLRLAAPTAVEMALPPINQWVHIAATYDGRDMRLYLQGDMVAMAAASGRMPQPFTPLYFGTRSQTAADGEYFSGRLDDIIIYERPLSAAEVRLLSEGRSP